MENNKQYCWYWNVQMLSAVFVTNSVHSYAFELFLSQIHLHGLEQHAYITSRIQPKICEQQQADIEEYGGKSIVHESTNENINGNIV